MGHLDQRPMGSAGSAPGPPWRALAPLRRGRHDYPLDRRMRRRSSAARSAPSWPRGTISPSARCELQPRLPTSATGRSRLSSWVSERIDAAERYVELAKEELGAARSAMAWAAGQSDRL